MATRILYLITKANWGGAQQYVYDLAVASQARGDYVTVAYGEPGELAARLKAVGIRTLPIQGLTRDVGLFREVRAFRDIMNLFKQEHPEVIHLNSSKAAVLGAFAARMTGVPKIVFTAHGWPFNEDRPWWQKMIFRFVVSLTILLAHKTICVSEAVHRDISWVPFSTSKIVVIYLGIKCVELMSREDARHRLRNETSALYWIGMVSELHPTKHVNDAITAFASIASAHEEAILVIIGEGEERAKLKALIQSFNLENRILLLGFVPDASTYLLAFDLFVHTSISEALGYVILEAGCAALPVIATRVGGIPEIITSPEFGTLITPRKPLALAHAIEDAMRDIQKDSLMGEHLKTRVQEHFSKVRMCEKTFAQY